MYILLSFVRVLIKNCKTIFLAKEDATRARLLAGVNAVLAANLVKMVVELNILTATLIAFFVNVAGCFFSITISKKIKNRQKYGEK